MSRYLVTGGCGFIGSHLVDVLLSQGHEVRVLDDLSTGKRQNLSLNAELIVGSITNRRTVSECASGVDGIFHLAAISSVWRTTNEWAESHSVNLTGTIHILDVAARAESGPIPVTYASSAAVYGNSARMAPKVETENPEPISPYGADKFGCELHARVAAKLHNVPAIGLRLFNVYGPRQDPSSPYSGVISIFSNRLRRDEPITIFGDGKQVRDFIFVRDVVRFFVAANKAKVAAGAVYNVCTGVGTTVLDLAKLTSESLGKAPAVHFASERAGDIRFSVGNATLASKQLACQAETTLKDGLKQTIQSQLLTSSERP